MGKLGIFDSENTSVIRFNIGITLGIEYYVFFFSYLGLKAR